jgi:nucleoside 2-deoxyribosyltransferase
VPEHKVYLAGPITGLTFEDADDWRQYARERLSAPVQHENVLLQQHASPSGIVGYSPLRAKDYLLERGVLSGHPDAYTDQVLSSAKGILTRDHWDVSTCDMMLVNFLGATSVSIGTVMEIAYASAYRKPVVVAMESDNVHVHAMLTESVGWIVDDLDYACDLVRAILLPDGVKVRIS